MKILKIIIWTLFFYLIYIATLAFWYLPWVCIMWAIIWWGIVSQVAYKIFYKKEEKWYNFLLYPLTYIFIIIGLWFIQENTTGLYKMELWDKQIVFQWMSHIGTKTYYQKVIWNMQEYRNKGYTVVYEGIKMEESHTWSKVNDKLERIFNGTDFLKNKYLFFEWEIIGKNIWKKGDIHIDISSREIEQLFKQKQKSENEYKKEIINLQAWVTQWLSINNLIYEYKQKYITPIDYILITWHYNLGLFLSDINIEGKKSILDSILKDYRDQHLYTEVMKLENHKIFIIYWEWHVNGFYRLLNQNWNAQVRLIKLLEPLKK